MNTVNALFELVGALLAWRSVFVVLRERPGGISRAQIAFSALWALESTPYYVAHGDWLSGGVALVRCAACLTWSGLALAWAREGTP